MALADGERQLMSFFIYLLNWRCFSKFAFVLVCYAFVNDNQSFAILPKVEAQEKAKLAKQAPFRSCHPRSPEGLSSLRVQGGTPSEQPPILQTYRSPPREKQLPMQIYDLQIC